MPGTKEAEVLNAHFLWPCGRVYKDVQRITRGKYLSVGEKERLTRYFHEEGILQRATEQRKERCWGLGDGGVHQGSCRTREGLQRKKWVDAVTHFLLLLLSFASPHASWPSRLHRLLLLIIKDLQTSTFWDREEIHELCLWISDYAVFKYSLNR